MSHFPRVNHSLQNIFSAPIIIRKICRAEEWLGKKWFHIHNTDSKIIESTSNHIQRHQCGRWGEAPRLVQVWCSLSEGPQRHFRPRPRFSPFPTNNQVYSSHKCFNFFHVVEHHNLLPHAPQESRVTLYYSQKYGA